MQQGIEIAISTYNRPLIVQQWLEQNLKSVKDLGMALVYYDSSTNDETEKIVLEYSNKYDYEIRFVRLPSSIKVDDKVLMAIVETDHEYIWPLGDSRCLDFDAVKRKVFSFLREQYDFMCVWSKTKKHNDGKTYNDPLEFFDECFWHSTWMGGLIFKSSIFAPLKNEEIKNALMKKYNREDAFNYLGMFYDLIAGKKVKGSMSFVDIKELAPNKTPGWLPRYMDVWCGNLCYLVDSIDDYYKTSKVRALKETWKILLLDEPIWCYAARKKGGLNRELFEHYDSIGYIDKVTDHKKRLLKYATCPQSELGFYAFLKRCELFGKRIISKAIGKI